MGIEGLVKKHGMDIIRNLIDGAASSYYGITVKG